jgi:hypothetical protein
MPRRAKQTSRIFGAYNTTGSHLLSLPSSTRCRRPASEISPKWEFKVVTSPQHDRRISVCTMSGDTMQLHCITV